MKKLFIATLPSGEFPCDYLEDLEKTYCVLHPAYNWESEVGQAALVEIQEQPPENGNAYKQMQLRDFWAIERSDIVVYDIDTNPGLQFLTAAVIYQKPIVAVSRILQAAPAYFSPDILLVCDPSKLPDMLHKYFNEP